MRINRAGGVNGRFLTGRARRRLRSSPPAEGLECAGAVLPISQIKTNQRNSKTHPAKQISQIQNSIVAFGFTNPLLVTEEGALIAGEGRYKAAQRLGLATVPVIVLAGLSPTKQRALAIADNRIAESRAGTVSALRSKYQS